MFLLGSDPSVRPSCVGRTREPGLKSARVRFVCTPTKLVELLKKVELAGKMRQLPLGALRKLAQRTRPLMPEL